MEFLSQSKSYSSSSSSCTSAQETRSRYNNFYFCLYIWAPLTVTPRKLSSHRAFLSIWRWWCVRTGISRSSLRESARASFVCGPPIDWSFARINASDNARNALSSSCALLDTLALLYYINSRRGREREDRRRLTVARRRFIVVALSTRSLALFLLSHIPRLIIFYFKCDILLDAIYTKEWRALLVRVLLL